MNNFDRCFQVLMLNEGAYSNDPNDSGGETMWGVTEKVARENGYLAEMKYMTKSFAKEIYRKSYWLPEFDLLPYLIAVNIFDAAVNSGMTYAISWAQISLNDKDVKIDGKFGPKTKSALESCDAQKFIRNYNGYRLKAMTNFKGWPSFSRGWARRISNNLLIDD